MRVAEAAHLPSGPPHLCDDVAQQRRTDGERLKDAREILIFVV